LFVLSHVKKLPYSFKINFYQSEKDVLALVSDVSRCSNRVLEKYKCFGFLSEESRCHIFEILLFMTLFIVIIPLLLEILEVFVYLPETLEPQS